MNTISKKLAFSLTLIVLVGLVACQRPANAQKPKLKVSPADNPLVDRIPFDRIYLDEFNKFATMDIVPLEEVPPKPIPTRGNLVFEWVEDNEFDLTVPWGVVIDFKTFNELLVEEADLLLANKDYSRTFRNLLHVYDSGGGNDPELKKTLQNVLLLDGKFNFDNQNYGLALSIFEDVYSKNPANGGPRIGNIKAIDMIMRGYDLMIDSRFEEREFNGVRAVLDTVERRYGGAVDPLRDRWDKRLSGINREFTQKAEAALAAGNSKDAHRFARKALFVLPDHAPSADLVNRIITKFPLVYVGVSQTAKNGGDPTRISHWGSRRMGHLTQRRIVEFDGLTDEGGSYSFLNGELRRLDDDGLSYEFKISDEPRFGVPPITAYQLSQQLVDRANEDSPQYHEAWAKIFNEVEITDSKTVWFSLRIPFIRPEALLQMPYEPADDRGLPIQNGPYVINGETKDEVSFSRNTIYEVSPDLQYPELVELKFDNPSQAVDAILKGDIDVVDRVPLQDLRKLARNSDIQVRKYIVPTIHMLVPNVRPETGVWKENTTYRVGDIVRIGGTKLTFRCVEARDGNQGNSGEKEPVKPGEDGDLTWAMDASGFVGNLTFRSGLMRALNRDVLLNDINTGGREVPGCSVINGPFPIGTDDNDQIAYAYNPRVPMVPHDRTLSAILVEVVRAQELSSLRKKSVPNPEVEIPPIVLAFPKGEVPRSVCQAISTMWSQARVQVVLRELEEGVMTPPDDNYDFLYVEMAMTEPMTDIDALFGANGIVKNLTPSVRQLMQRVSYATSWQVAGRQLREMHRQTINGTAVIPLYQIQEYFAYRKNVSNIGRDLVNLYENIDQWKVVPWQMEKEE